jgi:hypothetical protein
MLSVLQKATCESIYRAYQERGENMMGAPLGDYTDLEQRRRIEQYVLVCSRKDIASITMNEMHMHGRLPAGYTNRWPVGDRAVAMPNLDVLKRDMDTLSRRA